MIQKSSMAIYQMVLLSFLLFISPNSSFGWLTEGAVKEVQELIEYTDQDGECPDPERMSFLIAFNGLSYLDQAYLDLISENFNIFSTIIVNSQKPPKSPNCRVIAFFRQHASSIQKEEMIAALRLWLTEKVEKTYDGNMAMYGPVPATHGAINAANCLVELHDTGAAALIQNFIQRVKPSDKLRDRLEQAELKLNNPCYKSLFQVLPNGQPQVCFTAEDLPPIELQSSNFRNTKPGAYVLSDQEKQKFVSLINGSQSGINFPKIGNIKSTYFVVRFENGYQACVQFPILGPHAYFFDNSTSEWCPHMVLKSDELYSWGKSLGSKRASMPDK